VAEVDHHELWQRCALTAAFAAREAREAGPQQRGRSGGWLREWELVRSELLVVSPDD
jgi:hypothetical protein